MTQQVLMSGISGVLLDNSSVKYMAIHNAGGTSGIERSMTQVIPCAGTIKKWIVKLNGAPGAGNKYEFEILINGVADVASKITIQDTDTEAEYIGDVALAINKRTVVKITPTSTPIARRAKFSIIFEPTNAANTIILGGCQSASVGTKYYPISSRGSIAPTTLQNDSRRPFPVSGTLTDWYIQLSGSLGAGNTWTYEIYKNGIATGKKITITGSSGSETATNITIAQDDIITVESVVTGSLVGGVHGGWGIIFVPDTEGEWVVLGGTNDDLNTTSVKYNEVANGYPTAPWATGEGGIQQYAYPLLIGRLTVLLSAAPGVGKSWEFMLRKDGADTGVSVTVADSNISGSTAIGETIAAVSSLAIESTPSANVPPLLVDAYWGFAASGIPLLPPVGSYGVLLGD